MLYPEKLFSPKFTQHQPQIKPILQEQANAPSFMKFGHNLGPSYPVNPQTKYAASRKIVQSPAVRIEKVSYDTSSAYIKDTRTLQDQAKSRSVAPANQNQNNKPRPEYRGEAPLTYKHQGI